MKQPEGKSKHFSNLHRLYPFMTIEGWDEFRRRVELLHGLPTRGQHDTIVREVQEWEAEQIVGLAQEQEYNETLKIQEIYERFTQEKEGG